MEQNLMESLKGKSREERKKIFDSVKQSLLENDMNGVNAGANANDIENPTSSVPYAGNWITSFGYVCRGTRQC